METREYLQTATLTYVCVCVCCCLDGPGWEQYPDVKAVLQPEAKDDGIFWVRQTDRQRACSRLRLRPRLRLRLLRVAALLSGRRYRLCLFTTPMPRGWAGLDCR
jgi:hypothetical protein